MITPISIAVSNTLQVSVAATGVLAQATTMPPLAVGLSDYSLLASNYSILPLWPSAFAADEQGAATPILGEDIAEKTGRFEEVAPWERQDAGLGERTFYAVDSSPMAQTGIALLAISAAVLTAWLARHRISNLAHRGWEGINRGREWAGQVLLSDPEVDLTPVTSSDPAIDLKMIPGFKIKIDPKTDKPIVLGKGGMGIVYLASPDHLWRHEVAIKLVSSANPSIKNRFLKEIEAMMAIKHDNVINIQNTGKTKDGRPYIVMEYVNGGTMEDWKQSLWTRLRASSISMRDFEREVAQLVAETAKGVTAMHRVHLIHRDLKPSNVFLTQQKIPKIADLGIVRSLDDDRTPLTEEGKIVGTPYFIPPEVITDPTTWSKQSDVYALGVMLFYILTGCYPYLQDGNTLLIFLSRVISPHVEQPDPRTYQPTLSDAMAAIVKKAMAKNPKERYASAEDFRAALQGYLDQEKSGSGSRLGDGDPLAKEFFGS